VPGSGDLPELTARETDILRSAAAGHSIRRTAQVLGIAPKTVENIQTRLFRKLGVRNRSGALAVADAFGLLPPADLAPAALTE
jgi:DNA-binding CsgD family transcriptional regulator